MITSPKLLPADLAALFPDFSNVVEIGLGGFKTVYRAEFNGESEVIKVIAIPLTDGSNDQERYRDECLQRVRREVNILNQCATPYMVKLGTLPLKGYQVGQSHYAIYSEEFLPGPDLRELIRRQGVLPDVMPH